MFLYGVPYQIEIHLNLWREIGTSASVRIFDSFVKSWIDFHRGSSLPSLGDVYNFLHNSWIPPYSFSFAIASRPRSSINSRRCFRDIPYWAGRPSTIFAIFYLLCTCSSVCNGQKHSKHNIKKMNRQQKGETRGNEVRVRSLSPFPNITPGTRKNYK